MSKVTEGYVLKSARSAPSNSSGTSGADSGVSRAHADVPGSYVLPGDLVEVAADQYRASVLLSPSQDTHEYLLWAANSSNLAVFEDPSWAITDGSGYIPSGDLTVIDTVYGTRSDGTDRVIVTDNAGRSIAGVVSVTVVRGDTGVEVVATAFASSNPTSGVVTLDSGDLALLGGGLSRTRGDEVREVSYYLAAQRFWWTRNDGQSTRFTWDGTTQRWVPLRGGPPRDVGVLLPGTDYTLVPRPSRYAVGDYLPGDPAFPDAYTSVRVGRVPDAVYGTPVRVLVVTDEQAADPAFVFPPNTDAIVGSPSGALVFLPAFADAYAGQRVWYVPDDFPDSLKSGDVGPLLGANLDVSPRFAVPVPDRGEYPLIRIGSRSYLIAVGVDTDADLAVLPVTAGEVGYSRTTGRLKFDSGDVAKSDPDDPGFDLPYLGAHVFYDGVTMTERPVRTRDPVALVGGVVGAANDMYVPASDPFPAPGVSGVDLVPDGTGTVPNTSFPPTTRPNGSGMVRSLGSFGDVIVFGRTAAMETVDIVEFESELPEFPFLVAKGRVVIAREEGTSGSLVSVGLADRVRFGGEQLYFLQAEVQPAQYTAEARVGSQRRGPFTLDGTEVLAFEVDGVPYLWSASALGAGTWSATAVAASVASVITGTGTAYALRDRVWVESGDPIGAGTVGFGWGSTVSGAFVDRDLSGCAAIGFLPGWRVTAGVDNWLPDAGMAFGVSRSSQNLDRTGSTADFRSTYRLTDAVVTPSVGASPVVTFTSPPLEDVAGYDDGVFFVLQDGLFVRFLRQYSEVVYRFSENRMVWAEQNTVVAPIPSRTETLPLGRTGVFGESMHPAVGTGFGLYLSPTGGVRTLLVDGEDYVLPSDGAPGVANLVSVVGGLVSTGARGSFLAGSTTFTDPDATFISDGAGPGWRLKVVSGDDRVVGSYEVLTVPSETTLTVRPEVPFLVAESTVSWELYRGFARSVYDPSILVDVVSVPFSPLTTDTFVARILTPIGTTPTDPADQTANRLVADVAEGVASGRAVALRFGGVVGDVEVVPVALSNVGIGTVGASTVAVPDVTDPHFTDLPAAFAVSVGSSTYTVGALTLVPVAAFTPGLVGNVIEFGQPGSGAIEGQLNLGTDVLTTHAGATIYYTPQFRDPAVMAAGDAEFSPYTGEINLSAPDLATYGGSEAHWVEDQVPGPDVQLGPIQGTVYFFRPLRAFQVVEVSYSRANTDGTRYIDPSTGLPVDVTEQLPLFVRLETATRIDARTYSFDPTGRAMRADIAAAVWVGPRLVTTGNVPKATIDYVNARILFRDDVDVAAVVRINYAVTQAFGGEQSYTVSSPPVWRAPLIIPAGGTTFTALGDRTAELVPGALLVVGTVCFYVANRSYDAVSDTTTVTVWPSSPLEAGTRDPGAASPASVTPMPVSLGYEPSGNAGFLMTVSAYYAPVDRGQTSVTVAGDITQYARPNHVFEIGGYPSLVVGSALSEDGTTTVVSVGSPFQRGFDPTIDVLRVSVRPVYPVGSAVLEEVGPVVPPPSAEYEVVRYGGVSPQGDPLPGRTLVPTVDYTIDEGTGRVTLVSTVLPTDRIVMSFTRRAAVGPFVVDGRTVYPTYSAGYVHSSTPTEDNGYLGATLTARYTFRSPDSFYVRTVTMADWMGEVNSLAAREVAATNPHGGPNLTIQPPQNNWNFGTAPYATARRETGDRDRAARRYIALYDGYIRAFEQVLETIDGRVIGDRDGKFRFWVGLGATYTPPGYEDEITGDLNPRNVWSMVFERANGSFGVSFDDPLVDPYTATQDPVTLVVSGDPPDPDLAGSLYQAQRRYILNDMDDRVVVGSDGVRMDLGTPGLPLFTVSPDYRATWSPSFLSRLFPEATLAFGTTYPGIGFNRVTGDPGKYVFLTVVKPEDGDGLPRLASTFLREILPVQNPALGVIDNVQGAGVRKRLPRGRVWAYSPDGFPEMDAVCVAAGLPDPNFTGNPRPAAIVTPLELSAFPVDPQTGLPDVTQLVAGGGGLFDLTTGDVTLSTPPWQEVDKANNIRPQVAYGVPDGTTYQVGFTGSVISAILGGLSITPSYPGVFVGPVYGGCIVTFAKEDGTDITDASDIAIIGTGDPGDTLPFDPEYGDTLYVVPPTGTDDVGTVDPPKIEEATETATNSPLYRTGFDVGLANRRGSFRDLSLPSIKDPSPLFLKELTGQNPVSPLTCIEADVEFTNGDTAPFEFPAMRGEGTNDSGDYGIPYLSTTNTELDRLAGAASTFSSIVETDTPIPSAVYPDEVVADAEAYTTATGTYPPAAIVATGSDFTPVTTAGSYTPHSGVGDVSEFDLVLVQTGSSALSGDLGAEGILHVGSVSAQVIEPPRFVTPSRVGDRIRYILTNAMTHVSSTGSSGVVVREIGGVTTNLNISTVGGLFFNDGTPAVASGGLNNILNPAANPFPNGNRVTVEIIDPTTATIVETITIDGNTVTGGLGVVVLAAPATATDKVLSIPAVGFVNFAALGGVAPGPVGPLDFKVSINTHNPASAFTQGSYTAYVDTDRLSFREGLDLRTAPERGAVYPASAPPIQMECRLTVSRVTASTALSTVDSFGGVPITFLNRDPVLNPGYVGYFDPSPGTGYGYVKASGFEGRNNVPLTPIVGTYRVAAMPSSPQSATGTILAGTGDVYDDSDAVVGITPSGGSVADVQSGDLLVVRTSSIGDAAVTAGTYVVRHATPQTEVFPRIVVGGTDGWLRVALPTVVAPVFALTLTLSSVRSVPYTTSGYEWNSSGRVWLFPDGSGDLTTAVSMAYSSLTVNPNGTMSLTLTTGTARNSAFVLIPNLAFISAASVGVIASGAVFIPVGRFASNLPANNTVAQTGVTHGFQAVTTGNALVGANTTFSAATLVDANAIVGYPATPPAAGQLGVLGTDGGAFPPASSGTFQSDPNTPVYREVPVFVDMRGVFTGAWSTTTHGVTGIRCLAPGDVVYAHDGLSTVGTGFLAQGGVFVEPSSPQAALDLADGVPKVVDATHAMADTDVGIPNPSIHGASPESVTFEVRRVRRWHAVLDGIGDSLAPLRFAYEVRRGTVAGYIPSVRNLVAQPDPVTGQGTQLGAFTDPDVNVNAGDVVRLLDANGDVVDTAEVARVVDGVTLWLRAPGFQEVVPAVGQAFEVYLRQAPVPHEQSNEQLLGLLTDQVILDRTADPTAVPPGTGGGYVTTTNELRDDGAIFSGVQVGDIVVVDPAGALAGPTGPASPVEYGVRPVGDISVPARSVPPYLAGAPSEFDDNRGFYRVTAVAADSLTVTGATDFSGVSGSDVVFGAVGQEYAVLPTVHGSTLVLGGVEGQMDLRPTHYADGSNSYAGTSLSVAPFSYRVIRPTTTVSDETVDLVLFIRERMLSWVEELRGAFDATKQGSYFVFQRDEHIGDIGSPTDPTDGLGVPSNVYVSGLSGLTGVAPFANTSDCLSVLDRRYWCLDVRLDREDPASLPGEPYASFESDNSSGGTYTVGSGRPVEPDRIDDVLDRTDRLRQLRFSWVRYRADRVRGTLPAMDRLSSDRDTARRAAKDLANIEKSGGST